jgi:hypothetical protein
MRMPFGKHKGEWVHDIPTDYLEWLVRNVELFGSLERAVHDTLRARGVEDSDEEYYYSAPPPPPPPFNGAGTCIITLTAEQKALALPLAEKGFRAMAHECHPDKGGDPEVMKQLNLLMEALRKQLK